MALLGAIIACLACARASPPEPMPPASAPRITVAVERLESLGASEALFDQRWVRENAPFWLPSSTEAGACEQATWRALKPRWSDQFNTSVVQFAGVSRRGEPRILVQSFCPWLAEIERRSNPTFENLAFPGSHTCKCYFSSICNPATQEVSELFQGMPCRR